MAVGDASGIGLWPGASVERSGEIMRFCEAARAPGSGNVKCVPILNYRLFKCKENNLKPRWDDLGATLLIE
jgi:hypothetical protein